MWPAQQQGQPMKNYNYQHGSGGVASNMQTQQQGGGYYNNNDAMVDSSQASLPQEITKIDPSYKRQPEGPILWFAGPPLNVSRQQELVHSLSYLDFKRSQNKN